MYDIENQLLFLNTANRTAVGSTTG